MYDTLPILPIHHGGSFYNRAASRRHSSSKPCSIALDRILAFTCGLVFLSPIKFFRSLRRSSKIPVPIIDVLDGLQNAGCPDTDFAVLSGRWGACVGRMVRKECHASRFDGLAGRNLRNGRRRGWIGKAAMETHAPWQGRVGIVLFESNDLMAFHVGEEVPAVHMSVTRGAGA